MSGRKALVRAMRGVTCGRRPPAAGVVTEASDVRQLVRDLPMAGAVDVHQLAHHLAELRGRPIVIRPFPDDIVDAAREIGESLPYGIWMRGERTDRVFYRPDATAVHQQHIILHELGHICCGHQPVGFGDLRRASGGDEAARPSPQEDAAELFAYLVERRSPPTTAHRYRILED